VGADAGKQATIIAALKNPLSRRILHHQQCALE
jgi:hypothetical protein